MEDRSARPLSPFMGGGAFSVNVIIFLLLSLILSGVVVSRVFARYRIAYGFAEITVLVRSFYSVVYRLV